MDYKLTSRTFLKFGKACIAMLTLFLTFFFQTSLFAQTAPVNPPTGGFNINGQLRVNSAVGDWFPGSGGGGSVFHEDGTAFNSSTSGMKTDAFNSNDDVFTNGSKFNDYVSNLKWFTNSAPDKNDINVALYHVSRNTANNDQWIFISGDRLSTNGTSYIDFELLQGTIVQNGDGTFTGTPDLNKANGGGRTKDDIIISMEYTNGGSKPNVYIYQWEKSGNTWSYQQMTPSSELASNAFAETNRTGSITNLPYNSFGTNSYQQYAFVEAGVNISYLLNLSGLACSGLNIQTLWVKTKASAASTAALKDFISPIPVNFQFGQSSITNPGPFCSSDNTPHTLQATPSGGTFKVDNVTATTFTPSSAGVGNHSVSYSFSGCTAQATFVVNPAATTDPKGDYTMCASDASVNLSGTFGGGATGATWSTLGSGTFSNVSTNGNTVTATYTPSAADKTAGSVSLKLTSTGQTSPCAAAENTATLTINPAATANTGGPYTICASDATVTVSGTFGGGATGATWSTLGSGGFSNISTNGNTVSATYTPSAADKTAGSVSLKLTSTGQLSPCASTVGTATLTINPSATANAGGPYTICASDASVNVSGTFGGGATGATWSTLGSGDFSNISTNGNTVTATYTPSAADITAGTVSLKLTSTGQLSPCAAAVGSATLTIKPNPGAPTVTPQNNCDGTSVLTASNYTGTLLWSTGATTSAIQVNDNNTYTVTQTVNGCTSTTGSGNATIKTTPAIPGVSMLTPTCTDKTFSVQVSSPIVGITYTLTQPGNANPAKVIDHTSAGDVIFTGLAFGDGYSVTATDDNGGCISDPSSCGGPSVQSRLSSPTSIQNQPVTLDKPITDVKAVPNPYNNVIRFTLQSDVSGQGSLELYNLLGQKVKTVYQGFIQKGLIQNIDYTVPGGAHTNLIYLFRVGNERKSGILIGAK